MITKSGFVFGLEPVPAREVLGVPPGARIRIRLRMDDFERAYVRNGSVCECYALMFSCGGYSLGPLMSRNERI